MDRVGTGVYGDYDFQGYLAPIKNFILFDYKNNIGLANKLLHRKRRTFSFRVLELSAVNDCTTAASAERSGSTGVRTLTDGACYSKPFPAPLATSPLVGPVQDMLLFKICCLMHSIYRGNSPEYLKNIVRSVAASRYRPGLRSALSTDYMLLHLRTKLGERAFSHASPSAWNALPEDIRATSDSAVFRKQLKTHYFSLAFNAC